MPLVDNPIRGILHGPVGPETRRWHDDTWGPCIEQAFAGKDNEGFIEKTRILGKYTFAFGTYFAILDVVAINNKGGLPVALQRLKFHYVPWLGATVAYTATVCAASSLRGGKTDTTNHVIAGFAAGAVIGKCARSGLAGFLVGAACAVFGHIHKESRILGYEVWPAKYPGQHGNPFSHKLDFTTHAKRLGYRPGYWARTPEEVAEVYKRGQLSDGNTTDRLW